MFTLLLLNPFISFFAYAEEDYNWDDMFYYLSHGENNRLIPLVNKTSDFYFLDFFEDNVIWIKLEYDVNVNESWYKSNLELLNLTTSKRKLITNYEKNGSFISGPPKIYKNKIGWIKVNKKGFDINENITYEIWNYDTITENSTSLFNITNINFLCYNIDIYENYIIWACSHYANNQTFSKIFLHDIINNQTKIIHQTNNTIDSRNLAIHNNRIVWIESFSQNNKTMQNLLYYDININKTTNLLSLDIANIVSLEFMDNIIVWEYVIYDPISRIGISYYNLTSKTKYTLFYNQTDYSNPSLYNNHILFNYENSSNLPYSGLYIHDILTKSNTRIVYSIMIQNPKIFGTRIVFTIYLNFCFNIFLYDLNTDSDNDGVIDYKDIDDDNDGYIDDYELKSGSIIWDNKSLPKDIDLDLVPDILDDDKDGDNFNNTIDKYPENPDEWTDADNDNLGDNQEDPYPNDHDNDGYTDDKDVYPNDPERWKKEEKEKGFIPGFEIILLFISISIICFIKRKRK